MLATLALLASLAAAQTRIDWRGTPLGYAERPAYARLAGGPRAPQPAGASPRFLPGRPSEFRGLLAPTLPTGQTARPPRVVDRIEAVVNGQPVLASEVGDAAWYARLSSGADCGPALSARERATALRHLEDAVLLEAAAAAEGFAPPEESTAAATLRRLTPRLAACHLEAAAAKELIGRQIRILGYLDLHFAGQAAPGEEQIESYYRNTFTPAARAHGLAVAPLADVHDTIAKLLLQQQRTQEEQQWLARLRAEATIEVIAPW